MQLPAARLSAQFSCRTCTFGQARTPQGIDAYFCIMCHHWGKAPAPLRVAAPSAFDMAGFSSVQVPGVTLPRHNCVAYTFEQVRASGHICIMCPGFFQMGVVY